MFSNMSKIFLYFALSILFGPLLYVYFSMFGDFHSLTRIFPFLDVLSDEVLIMFSFVTLWAGFYFMLSFYHAVRKWQNRPPHLDWWQRSAIYQIYVRTFADSNDDGVGDLRGIAAKLDYIREKVGAEIIWLTPCYPSGGKDGGYDITNFVEIDPAYGTMKDFEYLVEKCHQKSMYIMMDLVPNHTSDQHEWFKRSCESDSPKNPYRDYYVWYPSKDSKNPPNNWVSVFGNSAWTYMETRKAWYLHQFLPEQPDLNFRCPGVQKELKNVFKFWLETKKVDGFRIDALKHLYESENFEDEPYIGKSKSSNKSEYAYKDYDHIYTTNIKETFELMQDWRRFCDEIGKRAESTKALVVETVCEPKSLMFYYGTKKAPMAHFPFNFELCGFRARFTKDDTTTFLINDAVFNAPNLKRVINDYYTHLPKQCWPTWQLGNHDLPRVATRVGRENVNLANVLNLLLGGTPLIYYGEEIGMEDLPKTCLKFEDCKDEFGRKFGANYLKYTRDFERTPMQWNGKNNAGFTGESVKTTWLPINPNYKNINVEKQASEKYSHLNIFAELMELRRSPSFAWGAIRILVQNEQILSFTRSAYDFPTFLVVMNISEKSANVNLIVGAEVAPRAYVTLYIPGSAPATAAHSEKSSNYTNEESSGGEKNYKDVDLISMYKPHAAVLTKSVFLKAYDCLILTWFSPN